MLRTLIEGSSKRAWAWSWRPYLAGTKSFGLLQQAQAFVSRLGPKVLLICLLIRTPIFDVQNDVFDVENDVFDVENDVFDLENVVFDVEKRCTY